MTVRRKEKKKQGECEVSDGARREEREKGGGHTMARPDPENVYIDLDSLVLERQMPLILQDCVSRDTLEKEVC